ncbi:hypothetical protein PF005_g26106 [Phytophthora fragariae]|uniref:Uncharacterized protein n=1 Tax=Phytophthora fragariae TaxID=53985 RepID=A0A6A3VXW4_9STRA|nr:hypothetical protein PF009_g25223 [Phytophthora fragariae]KAE8973435.1 hypothetical protein PF011_g25255 [Phytophthora fragariae]KAE9095835.1 hypothetical protein PF007_g17240 [Phytophthora fragariae]KAE9096130.1 hypothetical protein PF006_g23848 [Phytophthora fragariae]KAE9173840.1 hypothetical protein PF005_g26106 [Phytophthora fragariae]
MRPRTFWRVLHAVNFRSLTAAGPMTVVIAKRRDRSTSAQRVPTSVAALMWSSTQW